MSGVQEGGGFMLLPKGEHFARIAEKQDKQTQNGDPMVGIKLVVISGPGIDLWVWDNIVLPLPNSPAAAIKGRTKHFLHCIDQPYEGDEVIYDSDEWVGQICKIAVDHEEPNNYHKWPKAIITDYILVDEKPANEATPF